MSNAGKPTMEGFEWTRTQPWKSVVPGDNGWCVRDAYCELFEWAVGSDEWSHFIEGPKGEDTPRLAEHLGLTIPSWSEISDCSAHPGVALFIVEKYELAHTVYVHDIRWLFHHWSTAGHPFSATADRPLWWYGWPLRPQYLALRPKLVAVLVDERQAPRPRVTY